MWDEPEKFLPSRFLGSDGEARASLFLPFQSGRRRCVGEKLGKALVFFTLASILRWMYQDVSVPTLLFFFRTFTPSLVDGNAWMKGVHGFTLCPPDYTVSLTPL